MSVMHDNHRIFFELEEFGALFTLPLTVVAAYLLAAVNQGTSPGISLGEGPLGGASAPR